MLIHRRPGRKTVSFASLVLLPRGCSSVDRVLASEAKGRWFDPSQPRHGFVNAAAWMMTRECVEKVGGFSPSFFHYGEDDNYTQRLQFHKLKLGVLPTSRIYHDREQRPPSKFFESGETFRREVIARSSNPNTNFSFGREWVSVFAHLGYALARVNIHDVKLQLAKVRLLAGIDKSTILANRERSKAGRAAFLDLDGKSTAAHPESMALRQVTSVQ
jgi:GT2 family glycosyltransferase